MKKTLLLFSLTAVFFFFSCGNQTNKNDATENDTLAVEDLQQDEITQMSALINEVSSCIDSIQIQEKMIFNMQEGTTDRDKMLIQLRSFKELLARKQLQINELTDKNASLSASSKKTIQNLQKMIDFLNEQLTEKTKQIEKLESTIQNKDVKIDELRYDLNEKIQESDYLKEQNYQQDKEMNTVFYVLGTKKELKKLNLIKSSVLGKKVKNENIDKSLFIKADKRSLKTIKIDSKKVKLLTNNPVESYIITSEADGTSTLQITDAEQFWKVSPYLIIIK